MTREATGASPASRAGLMMESWGEGRPVTVAAPALGSPYAVMVLEKLIALEARMVLALGWCGSLTPQVRVGHLVLPDGAVSTEGTSPHYLGGSPNPGPDMALLNMLKERLPPTGLPWRRGPIWTTDAYYRETVGQVQHFQQQGILAVEMEMAALFAVARFRGISLAGLLVVSDELFELSWRPGRGAGLIRQAREGAARLLLETAAAWRDSRD